MNRDRHEAVTGFALLVPASASEAMGEATFLSEIHGPQHVRAMKLEELRKQARQLRGLEAEHFSAMLALRGALESGDKLAMDRAMDRMVRVYRLRENEASEPIFASHKPITKMLASRMGMTPREVLKYMGGVRSGTVAAENPWILLSYEVTRAVGSVPEVFSQTKRKPFNQWPQIVLWWMDGALRPAIYCPDPTTALYIHTFLIAPTGALGFRTCPYDGEQFFQDRPNQEYCCPAHREAHRVARFRDNKRRKTEERGKHHGAQKAR
jgi:hypothetical protein